MNNLFYYTTSIRVAPGAKYEIPQTRSIPAAITHATFQSNCTEGLHFSAFHYYCCACSKASISIYKYIQKAGEPEDDAGFLKHIAS